MDAHTSDKIRQISFVAIICVIFVHSTMIGLPLHGQVYSGDKLTLNTFVMNFMSQGVMRIGLPFFFAFSGYLFFLSFKRFDSFGTYYRYAIKKRIRSIVGPYYIWKFAYLGFLLAAQAVPLTAEFFNQAPILKLPRGELLRMITIDPVPYHMWYLRDIMLYFVFSPLYYPLMKRMKGLLFPALIFLLWMYTDDLLVLKLKNFFFFSVGCSLAIHNLSFPRPSKRVLFLLAFAWPLFAAVKTWFAFSSDLIVFPWMYKISLLFGTYFLWYVFDYTHGKPKQILVKASHYTFFIYLAHEPTISIIRKLILRPFAPNEGLYLAVYLGAPVITLLVVWSIGVFLHKRVGWLYAFLLGGRR